MFFNRGFTLLQWLLNLVLQIPHFTLNIKGQCNTTPKLVSQHDIGILLLAFTFVSNLQLFWSCPTGCTPKSFTNAPFLWSETHEAELWFGMTDESQSLDISMLFLAPLWLTCLAVTLQPSSDSLLTECLFLIAQASLSIFSSFSAQHDGRSPIIYSAGHA